MKTIIWSIRVRARAQLWLSSGLSSYGQKAQWVIIDVVYGHDSFRQFIPAPLAKILNSCWSHSWSFHSLSGGECDEWWWVSGRLYWYYFLALGGDCLSVFLSLPPFAASEAVICHHLTAVAINLPFLYLLLYKNTIRLKHGEINIKFTSPVQWATE